MSDATGPIIGASVVEKGTANGTITDLDGNFSLNVKAGATLVVSYVGYKSEEVKAGRGPLNITLKEDAKALDEVVVTALGIKRERKALGYGIDEVKGEALTKAKETNLINSMAGRVPGLVVSQTAGGPSGSTRVILRGSTEMTGNNQPLYVVDGVPLAKERVVPEQRNKKILDGVRAIAFRDLSDILKDLDRDLVKGAFAGEHFAENFFPACKDEKLAATVKELMA